MRFFSGVASRNSLTLLIVALAFVAVALIRGRFSAAESFSADLIETASICEPSGTMREDLAFLVAGTRFEGRLRINQRPAPGALTVLFACGRHGQSSSSLTRVRNNCAYVGEPATVACDADFFDAFIDHSGLARELRPFPSAMVSRDLARGNLAVWMLGHEIGHAIRGHRSSHFTADRISEMVASSSLDHKHELEADAWFVGQLSRDASRRLSLETLLLDLLYAQVRAKVGTDNLSPATGVPLTSSLITYAEEGTHPEYVVRIIRMLSISLRPQPEALPFLRQVDALADAMRKTPAATK